VAKLARFKLARCGYTLRVTCNRATEVLSCSVTTLN
jgi:hypothetical protein